MSPFIPKLLNSVISVHQNMDFLPFFAADVVGTVLRVFHYTREYTYDQFRERIHCSVGQALFHFGDVVPV